MPPLNLHRWVVLARIVAWQWCTAARRQSCCARASRSANSLLRSYSERDRIARVPIAWRPAPGHACISRWPDWPVGRWSLSCRCKFMKSRQPILQKPAGLIQERSASVHARHDTLQSGAERDPQCDRRPDSYHAGVRHDGWHRSVEQRSHRRHRAVLRTSCGLNCRLAHWAHWRSM